MMDNFRAHKVPSTQQAIKNARATIRYLPKYSPDLNPIEMPYGNAQWRTSPRNETILTSMAMP